MDRRRFFTKAMGIGSIGFLAGCLGDESETSDEPVPEQPMEKKPETPPNVDLAIETVLDARRLGADPTGSQSITPLLRRYLRDGTVIAFPDGRYLVDPFFAEDLSDFGLVSKESASPTLVPAEPVRLANNSLIRLEGENVVLSGFDFDFREEGYGGNIFVVAQRGDFHVSDIRILGVVPDGVSGLATGVFDPNGTGVVERFIARDGSKYGTSSHGALVKYKHAGQLYFRDCEIWNWSDNGLYASGPGYIGDYNNVGTSDRGNGEVHVEGGVYKNNNIANIRIGTTDSSVRRAVVRNEEDPSGDTWDSREHDLHTAATDAINSRGIWVRNRDGLLIDDCTIVMETGQSSGAIVSGADLGTVTVRDTDITVTTDEVHYPIRVGDTEQLDAEVTLDGVVVTGTGGKRRGISIEDRDGTTVTNCHIELTGSRMDGIVFMNSKDTSVADSYISVPGKAIVYNNSSGTIKNVERPSDQRD